MIIMASVPLAAPATVGQLQRMEETATVDCPYCGQSMEMVLDTSIPSQRFVTDCEICCRPFEVTAECEPGEVLSVMASGG